MFEDSEAASIDYKSGQFLTFVFPKENGGQDRRSYSISSAPVLHEPLQVTVRRVPNGIYSRWFIDHAKEGDALQTTGATGFFVLPDDMRAYDQLIFFAAGSGITPVFSLIKTVLNSHTHVKIVLLYSNAAAATTIFWDELHALQHKFPLRLTIEFLFSAARRRLNVGMIEQVAKRYSTRSLFYLCGPAEYMRTITIVLRTSGITDGAIHREIFHIEKPAIKELPPDGLPHAVRLVWAGKEYAFTVQYPVTILQAAKQLDIQVPFSCEAGQCGTCAATCVAGKVWMWHNDVLMDEELSAGRVLTCTGYPVEGDVRLEY